MANERGWKDGVYNPGFGVHPDYLRLYKERAQAEGYSLDQLPEIKGVRFKQSKGQHLPLRNKVTRVVMVGFDPFNHSGLPEHIERKVVFDYWARLENEFVQGWVDEAGPEEERVGLIAWTDGYKIIHP